MLEPKSNSILGAIVLGMQATGEGENHAKTRLASANALLNALEFGKKYFNSEVSGGLCTITGSVE